MLFCGHSLLRNCAHREQFWLVQDVMISIHKTLCLKIARYEERLASLWPLTSSPEHGVNLGNHNMMKQSDAQNYPHHIYGDWRQGIVARSASGSVGHVAETLH